MKITLLLDNPGSWFRKYAEDLLGLLKKRRHEVSLVYNANKVREGDVAVFLSCEGIIPLSIRERNTHNLVVHESALPKGRGWSPLTWQIIEGKNKIPITIFEAEEAVDSGRIYSRKTMQFDGRELVEELRRIQGEKTIELILEFVDRFALWRKSYSYRMDGKKQSGKPTFYPRRRPKDSELDPKLPLKKLFNQLRVADNERYPAFFIHRGQKYFLKISKAE